MLIAIITTVNIASIPEPDKNCVYSVSGLFYPFSAWKSPGENNMCYYNFVYLAIGASFLSPGVAISMCCRVFLTAIAGLLDIISSIVLPGKRRDVREIVFSWSGFSNMEVRISCLAPLWFWKRVQRHYLLCCLSHVYVSVKYQIWCDALLLGLENDNNEKTDQFISFTTFLIDNITSLIKISHSHNLWHHESIAIRFQVLFWELNCNAGLYFLTSVSRNSV